MSITQANTDNWVVYLLKCADDTLYCGISNQLENRIKQHNGELVGGAKYTQSRRPCELIYYENTNNRSEATKREYAIKAMSRIQKLTLIKNQNIDD